MDTNTIIIWSNDTSRVTLDSSIFVWKIIFFPPPTFLYSPNRFNPAININIITVDTHLSKTLRLFISTRFSTYTKRNKYFFPQCTPIHLFDSKRYR